MRIKKMYQGEIPENKIVGTYTESNTDAYTCNYVNEKYAPSIITARLDSNFYSSSEWGTPTLNQDVKIGTKLSMSNGKVLIGKGVHHVKVSANVFLENCTNISYYFCAIRRNTARYKMSIITTNKYYMSASFTPAVITVAEGDTIDLQVNNPNYSGYQTVVRGGAENTWLTVEVVD